MKKAIILVLVSVVLLAALTACGSKTVKVDQSMNGQTITVKKGQTIVVSLDGNPTTGFNWAAADLDTTILTQQGDAAFKADSNLIGAGGMVSLTFEAVGTGTTTLTLNYARSWETGVEPEQIFSVTVVVE